MSLCKTKLEAYREVLEMLNEYLSSCGCNDFVVENTPEMYDLLEKAGAANLSMTLEEFRNSPDYEDYKPSVSKDGTKIFTTDYTILYCIENELGV